MKKPEKDQNFAKDQNFIQSACNDCNYPRNKKQKLIRHMKRVHMKIKDFKCEQCGYTCSKKQYLDRHIKHVPTQIKGFIFIRVPYINKVPPIYLYKVYSGLSLKRDKLE